MTIGELETIRLASLADAADLARVHVLSWREAYEGMLPASMLSSLSVDRRTASWKQIMETSGAPGATRIFVAEIDHRIVAFGSCGSQRTPALNERGYDGEISAIYVLKAFQRRAIGKRLLSAMASDLSGRGFRATSLWVLRDNAVARRFYDRYGGQVIGEKEDARTDGVLIEVAYGWTQLADLMQLAAD
jgi:GNAT superfamily N-acetyltransferase